MKAEVGADAGRLGVGLFKCLSSRCCAWRHSVTSQVKVWEVIWAKAGYAGMGTMVLGGRAHPLLTVMMRSETATAPLRMLKAGPLMAAQLGNSHPSGSYLHQTHACRCFMLACHSLYLHLDVLPGVVPAYTRLKGSHFQL